MADIQTELAGLARHLEWRRAAILQIWRNTIRRDRSLTAGDALPRAQLNDHIPEVLAAFERQLREPDAISKGARPSKGGDEAAAHGLHRWQQGYDLREVTRELGLLNEVMVAELDAYAQSKHASHDVMAAARRAWAATCTMDVEESTSQFFRLQRLEAAGHVQDLEQALRDIGELDQQRAELWRQIAHDLRGNVGVVASAAHGLTLKDAPAEYRERFLHMLERNIKSLRHLLDDVTSLTKLQAGGEKRQLAEMDAASLLSELCEGLQAFAHARNLYLRVEGPAPFWVEGDALKTRRLAQNLILNALKYTVTGGVTVTWSLGDTEDKKRWALTVRDTGPGFRADPGRPVAGALKEATELTHAADAGDSVHSSSDPQLSHLSKEDRPVRQGPGEGIGLSIVKRLSDLLDASVEVESAGASGTTVRVLAPVRYSE
ncbi:Sensor protein EvgS precursor [Variovorax sp. SRS16]|uniref:sensor histidine kinase n=1 Tax=Variovorax sp. SRS16 TaxID=282217 RepID=UPI001315D9EB|nr:sensor histidine kinase [Variovorax sp. SRS16]VTU18159.1 Sensor protein EvgS precursor [Variovorax sp. SRS16]